MQVIAHFARRGLQVSPSNPLGLIDEGETSDLLLDKPSERPLPSPPSEGTSELLSLSDAGASISQRLTVDGEGEAIELPAPVQLGLEERRLRDRVKIGALVRGESGVSSPDYDQRVNRLVAYLDSGSSLEEATAAAEFSEEEIEEILESADLTLQHLSY